jgi:predicted ATP-dependent serine protease
MNQITTVNKDELVHKCKVCELYIVRNRVPVTCSACGSMNMFLTLPLGTKPPEYANCKSNRRNIFSDIFSKRQSIFEINKKHTNGKIIDPSKVERKPYLRSPTGIEGLDKVLGGGLAEGYVVMLAGPPGAGKSTIFTQASSSIQEKGMHYGDGVAYGGSEEDEEAIIETADRVSKANFKIALSTSCNEMIRLLDDTYSHTWVIDSLMNITVDELDGEPGSPSQVIGCSSMLYHRAHATGQFSGMSKRSIMIVAHGTKDGSMAGPLKALHSVDGAMIYEHVDPDGNADKKIPPWFPIEDQSKPTGYVRIRVLRKMRKSSNKSEAYFQMQPRYLDAEETILNPIGGRLDTIDGPEV